MVPIHELTTSEDDGNAADGASATSPNSSAILGTEKPASIKEGTPGGNMVDVEHAFETRDHADQPCLFFARTRNTYLESGGHPSNRYALCTAINSTLLA